MARDHKTHAHGGAAVGAPDKRLLVSLVLNLAITLAQIVGGFIANSLGLLSDAAHNLSDVVALALSLWAVRLARRAATRQRTYAFKRAEVLVALFNSAVLVALSAYIVVEATRRLTAPTEVDGLWVIAFAGGGLLINSLAAFLLRSHGHDLNLRSAFLHLVSDAFISFGVVLGGLVVYLSGWNYADAIVSILVSLWIAREAFSIVKRAINVLMEGTPEGVEYEEVQRAMRAVPGIDGVHDLHIWALSSNDLALSAHLVLEDAALSAAAPTVATVKELLDHEFGIGHVTLELETTGGDCAGGVCSPLPGDAD